MKITASRLGKEVTLWVTSDDGTVHVPLGTALNLPDAKLASRGQITRLQAALERVTMADVQETP